MISEVSIEGTSYANYPKNLEAGTPNIAGVIGMRAALAYVNGLEKELIRHEMKSLTNYCEEKLKSIDEVALMGSPSDRFGILSFNIKGIHPHDAASFLNKDEIAVRAGMHCTQPLLNYLHVPATLRVSFSIYNTKEEVDRLHTSLVELIKFWS